MEQDDEQIVISIYNQVNQIRNNGFEPNFLILNDSGFRELSQYLGRSTFKVLDYMLVVLDSDSSIKVKVLCDPTIEFKHRDVIRK